MYYILETINSIAAHWTLYNFKCLSLVKVFAAKNVLKASSLTNVWPMLSLVTRVMCGNILESNLSIPKSVMFRMAGDNSLLMSSLHKCNLHKSWNRMSDLLYFPVCQLFGVHFHEWVSHTLYICQSQTMWYLFQYAIVHGSEIYVSKYEI
jgi:hypothetical protein